MMKEYLKMEFKSGRNFSLKVDFEYLCVCIVKAELLVGSVYLVAMYFQG